MQIGLDNGEKNSLLLALQLVGINLNISCGGKGTCGKCKISILSGKYSTENRGKISAIEKSKGIVLACQTILEPGETIVEIPDSSLAQLDGKIEAGSAKKMISLFNSFGINLDSRAGYGIALDIGTTTLAAFLVSLHDGKILDYASSYNPQIYVGGDDVISRIMYTEENTDGLKKLRQVVVNGINSLIDAMVKQTRLDTNEIKSVSIAGNTTMTCIFWGVDPSPIRLSSAFTYNDFTHLKGEDSGLKVNPQAEIFTSPAVGNYVGGDITAGLLAARLISGENSLFIDVGTNGEIVIGDGEWLITAACSVGPAFEGSGISCGMRATEGAIERIRFDNDLDPEIKVIGQKDPIGICGSGIIEVIAEMFTRKLIDSNGKFTKLAKNRIRETDNGQEYVIFKNSENEIVLAQSDIKNVVLAKAAVHAGIATLLREVGIETGSLDKIYVAGGFGRYLNIDHAIDIGMFPKLSRDKFRYLGNTSIAGSYLALHSVKMQDKILELADKMTYIDLSSVKSYMDEFRAALFIPHTNV